MGRKGDEWQIGEQPIPGHPTYQCPCPRTVCYNGCQQLPSAWPCSCPQQCQQRAASLAPLEDHILRVGKTQLPPAGSSTARSFSPLPQDSLPSTCCCMKCSTFHFCWEQNYKVSFKASLPLQSLPPAPLNWAAPALFMVGRNPAAGAQRTAGYLRGVDLQSGRL